MARKATAVVEPEEEIEYEEVPTTRSGRRVLGARGHLQADVKKVIDSVLEGTMEIEEGAKLTPHRVAALVAQYRAYETGVEAEIPSTGAVSAVFERWSKNGVALFTEKPKAFKAYTAAAKKNGVQAVIDKSKAQRKAQKAAERVALNGTDETEEPKPVPAKRAPRKRAAKKVAAS